MDKKILLKSLLEYFYNDNLIPLKLDEMRLLWRDVFNNLDLKFINDDMLSIEDKLLRLDLLNKGLTNAEKLESFDYIKDSHYRNGNKIILWKGNITNIYADIVVNSIRYEDLINRVFNNDIFFKSGMRLVKKFSDIVSNTKLDNSDVLITRGFNLPCDLIIHVIEPKDSDEEINNEIELKMSYMNILECANNNMMKTVVIPTLGSNSLDFLKRARIAVESIDEYLDKDSMIEKVIICASNEEEYDIYKSIFLGEDNA